MWILILKYYNLFLYGKDTVILNSIHKSIDTVRKKRQKKAKLEKPLT